MNGACIGGAENAYNILLDASLYWEQFNALTPPLTIELLRRVERLTRSVMTLRAKEEREEWVEALHWLSMATRAVTLCELHPNMEKRNAKEVVIKELEAAPDEIPVGFLGLAVAATHEIRGRLLTELTMHEEATVLARDLAGQIGVKLASVEDEIPCGVICLLLRGCMATFEVSPDLPTELV